MASWYDPGLWAGLLDGSACPFCVDGPRNVIATLPATRVTVEPAVNVRGYCCLVLRAHAVELHALSADEGAALMRDIQRAARALQDVTGAVKINYEIHGNILPHIHVHLIARYPDDAIERTGRAFSAQTEPVWAPGEFDAFRRQLAESLND